MIRQENIRKAEPTQLKSNEKVARALQITGGLSFGLFFGSWLAFHTVYKDIAVISKFSETHKNAAQNDSVTTEDRATLLRNIIEQACNREATLFVDATNNISSSRKLSTDFNEIKDQKIEACINGYQDTMSHTDWDISTKSIPLGLH